MDNHELERERGITIRSKHCTFTWRDYLMNIIDTPGHADFSGEVERVLSMVDSVLLLVDANEGAMPQTRYVLMRALRLGLKPIVIINKVDRPNARPDAVLDEVFNLFLELGADDKQADFPVLYGSGLDGWLVRDLGTDVRYGMDALFETIIENVEPPKADPDAPFLMQVSTLAWSDYIGRIGCGKVLQGRLRQGQAINRIVTKWRKAGKKEMGWDVCGTYTEKAEYLWVMRGLQRVEVDEIGAGDIVWVAGPEDINIGDTFSAVDADIEPLQPLEIEEPSVSMLFLVNNSPFASEEGRVAMLPQLKERLERELRTNVALRVQDIGRPDAVKVLGRGELHLAILIEEMRREGLEFCVSRPEIIPHHDEKGEVQEPMEQLIIDVPEEYQGAVIEKIARRKGEMVNMHNRGTGVLRMEFEIPTRGLIGYRSEFLTDTRGLGIMASRFIGYGAWRGEVASRNRGSLISMEMGVATSYTIENLQQRATMFIEPNERIYEGQIVGENSRPDDMPCKPTKKKPQTNHRASNKDNAVTLNVPKKMSLDQALEWIGVDELVEVTPKSIRLRKALLGEEERKQALRRRMAAAG